MNSSFKDFEMAIKINPRFVEAYNNLGNVFKEFKKLSEALYNYDEAIKINPRFAEAYNNRSIVLNDLNRLDSALKSANKAIEINPKYAEAYNSNGLILKKLERFEEALKSYSKAIEINPNFANAYINRGNILLNEIKQVDEALENFIKALKIDPKLDFQFGKYIHIKFMLSDWSLIDKEIKSLKNRIINGERAATPFSILSIMDAPDLHQITAKKFVEKQYPSTNNLGPILKRIPSKKIRIGYYSADFRNHPVSNQIINLIEKHNKSKFEIFAFSLGKKTNDQAREKIFNAVDQFIDVSLKNDLEIAKISRELNIDIAIDLMGFTHGNRHQIFAEKCAPVQVGYLGYSGTTGSDFIDYIIADKTLIPKESQKYFSEKIVYLPNSFMVGNINKKIPDKIFTREELGFTKEGFIYCCFNQNYKINPKTFEIWIRILKNVDGSYLWLSKGSELANNNLIKETEKREIDPSRIIFAQKVPLLEEHLARYRIADLFLDTLPYNGHSTANDSLCSGLPVLTLIGNSFASRVSASLLNAIGLPELITYSEKEYEQLAIKLASNKKDLENIKNKLENNRSSKPLFNTNLFAKDMESAYETIYKRYLEDLKVENIEI